jgi:nucleotidyltransferase/DNA polymerase involved in DNA repair
MSEAEAAAQAELPHIVDRLTAIRSQLRQMVESLAADPEVEASSLDENEMDVTTEVRSIIECVLNDSIQPAIRDLRVAAAYRVKRRGEG